MDSAKDMFFWSGGKCCSFCCFFRSMNSAAVCFHPFFTPFTSALLSGCFLSLSPSAIHNWKSDLKSMLDVWHAGDLGSGCKQQLHQRRERVMIWWDERSFWYTTNTHNTQHNFLSPRGTHIVAFHLLLLFLPSLLPVHLLSNTTKDTYSFIRGKAFSFSPLKLVHRLCSLPLHVFACTFCVNTFFRFWCV